MEQAEEKLAQAVDFVQRGQFAKALPLFRDVLRRAGEVFPEIRWRGSGAWAGRRKR